MVKPTQKLNRAQSVALYRSTQMQHCPQCRLRRMAGRDTPQVIQQGDLSSSSWLVCELSATWSVLPGSDIMARMCRPIVSAHSPRVSSSLKP